MMNFKKFTALLGCLFVALTAGAAGKKISDYTETFIVGDAWIYEIAVPGVTNFKVTFGTIATNIIARVPVGSLVTNVIANLNGRGTNITAVGTLTATNAVVVSATEGTEKVSNGGFGSDLTGWSGANWAWSSGTALHTAGSVAPLIQSGTAGVTGETYKVVFTVSGGSVGSVRINFGGVWGGLKGERATYTEYLTAVAAAVLYFTPTSDFDGSIDNVSIKRVTQGTLDVGTTLDIHAGLTIRDRINIPEGLPISIGYETLMFSTNGIYNVPGANIGIGYQAGKYTTEGQVTAVGYMAGQSNSTGVLTAYGKWAGQANTSGHATFIGNSAGQRNTTSSSTSVGDESGAYNQTNNLTTVGYYSGQNMAGSELTAIGYNAARYSTGGVATVVGHQAGITNRADGLTAVGYEASFFNTTGLATSHGHRALYGNTSGNSVGIGYNAGFANTSGHLTAVGYNAGRNNTTGASAVLGYQAGYNTTSGAIAALGYQAGYAATDGLGVYVGYNSGFNATSGDLICIGYRAGYGVTAANSPITDYYGILIGSDANRSVVSATQLTNYVGLGNGVLIDRSNQYKIGNSNVQETILRGKVAVGHMAGDGGQPPLRQLHVRGAPGDTPGSGVILVMGAATDYGIEMGAFTSGNFGNWIQSGGYTGGTNYVVTGPLALNHLGGNVGINTSNPTNALDVNGHTSIRSNLFLPNLPTNGSPVALLAVDAAGAVYETSVSSGGAGDVTTAQLNTSSNAIVALETTRNAAVSNGVMAAFNTLSNLDVYVSLETFGHVTIASNLWVTGNVFTPNLSVVDFYANTATFTNGFYYTPTVIQGVGDALTNFTVLSTRGESVIAATTNVIIRAVMGYDAASAQYWNLSITNGSGADRTVFFSAATNSWRFAGAYGTNAPSLITNNTVLAIRGRSQGTNIQARYDYYAWP